MKRIALALVLSLTVLCGQVYATAIGSGAFSGSAIVESFEGLSVGPGLTSGGGGFLEPVTPFTFGTGVILTGPNPNPGKNPGTTGSIGGVVVGDWNIGSASWGLFSNGTVSSASDVPFGDAYIGLDDDLGSVPGPMEFTFAQDMIRVGAYVTAATFPSLFTGNITLTAFDASNTFLETVNISAVNVSSWGSNFLGVENVAGIRKVQFSSDFLVLDNLLFEPVPEPATLLLLGTGLAGIAVIRRRKRL